MTVTTGAALAMVKLCSAPVAARWVLPSVTDACSVHSPGATKLTPPSRPTSEERGVVEVGRSVPSPDEAYYGVKLPPKAALPGMLLMRTAPVALAMVKL